MSIFGAIKAGVKAFAKKAATKTTVSQGAKTVKPSFTSRIKSGFQSLFSKTTQTQVNEPKGTFVNRFTKKIQSYQTVKNEKINEITKEKINLASKSVVENGFFTRENSKIFYRATQDIWQGKTADKNALIIEKLGAKNLEEAYKMVLKDQADAVKAAKGGAKTNGWTDQNEGFYKEVGQDKQTSPDYLDYVKLI